MTWEAFLEQALATLHELRQQRIKSDIHLHLRWTAQGREVHRLSVHTHQAPLKSLPPSF